MRLLLDTHALLWWLVGDKRLPRRVRTAISGADNAVFVSAASAWEVSTKHRLGKLPEGDALVSDFARHVAEQEFVGLDITLEHGQRAGTLPGPHRDPFDRMLIAQAQAEHLVVVSSDAVFDEYGLRRVW
ncbi:MAG: type II toxin-antitoxin system VapC family toxin [Gemmatimonadaceae bacterium]